MKNLKIHVFILFKSPKYAFLFLFLQKLQLSCFSAALLHLRGRVA